MPATIDDTQGETGADPEDALEDLSAKQIRLVAILAEHDGEAHTETLTDEMEESNGNVGHHMKAAIRAGMVEKAGSVDVGAPIPANNYRLTEAGQQAIDETGIDSSFGTVTDDDGAPDGSNVEELRMAVRAQSDRIDELEGEIELLEAKFDTVYEYVEELEEKVV